MRLSDERLPINELVGQPIRIEFTGKKFCIRCGKWTKKTYGDGCCYPCFRDGPQSSPCIIRPELCLAHEGEGRDMEWERKHHLVETVVYLANSGGLKVGVTKNHEPVLRWMDQGAIAGMRLAVTPFRHPAGLIEVTLKSWISDRTPWRKMVSGEDPKDVDLLGMKRELSKKLNDGLRVHVTDDDAITEIRYPVNSYPTKVKSTNLAKESIVERRLEGIRGQYLLFEGGHVLNIRRHAGFVVSVEW